MEIRIPKQRMNQIQKGMIGLFFEDINYAADGGLYAEMIENRSFEFMEAGGDSSDYYVWHDGLYGWSEFPEGSSELACVTGSPLCTENPHYMRVLAKEDGAGFANKAYDGIALRTDTEYNITFFARCITFDGDFIIKVSKDNITYAEATISSSKGTNETYNRFKKYTVSLKANNPVENAVFSISLSTKAVVEFDFISMFPTDAVAGIFRKDLFQALKDLCPGFIRFPGGCIVEGNTLENRYKFKDSLIKEPWRRKNNWNRWAVHENSEENGFRSEYSHYNQTMGLGYYEYFLLCELIGAKPLPVVSVGLACQYQTYEQVSIDSPEFNEFLQEAIELIEFANGGEDTVWGKIRCEMGHKEPFNLELLGVGNEQWQSERADFFERYTIFEEAIHAYDSGIKIIGSAGPDITSERYDKAWDFYRKNAENKNFVYAIDEHYYVEPQWLYENNHFYDNYSRDLKVFAGEYAAHPTRGMNKPTANTLNGALSEAAFLTGIERNADVVVLASYAPLFARINYAQWSPDMIWFDSTKCYATPSYYVQQMYSKNMGTVTLSADTKNAEKENIFFSLSYNEDEKVIIVKAVNPTENNKTVSLSLSSEWGRVEKAELTVLAGNDKDASNSLEQPCNIKPYSCTVEPDKALNLPPLSFSVLRLSVN